MENCIISYEWQTPSCHLDSKSGEVRQTCGWTNVIRRKKKKLDCKTELEFKPHRRTHRFARLSPSLPLILSWIHFFCQLHLPLVPLVRRQTELCRVENSQDLNRHLFQTSHLFLQHSASHWLKALTCGHFLWRTGWYSVPDCPLVCPSPN